MRTIGRTPRANTWRTPAIAITVLVVLAGLVVAGVLALGGVTRRPEGAAERFLQAVSSGEDIESYGSTELARRLFGEQDVEFDQIEVGAAATVAHLRVVPFRVVVEDTDREIAMSLTVESVGDGWRVTDAAPRGPLTQLSVPSEGGAGPAGASAAVWVGAVAAVLVLTALAELVLRAIRAPVRPAA